MVNYLIYLRNPSTQDVLERAESILKKYDWYTEALIKGYKKTELYPLYYKWSDDCFYIYEMENDDNEINNNLQSVEIE